MSSYSRSKAKRARLTLELLEDRCVPSAVLPDVHDQQIFHVDDLESGVGGWVIDNKGLDRVAGTADDGLWHLTARHGSDPGHSGTSSLYYGNDSTGTYDTGGRTTGTIMSPLISLPAVAANEKLNLSFKSVLDTPAIDPANFPQSFSAAFVGVVTGDTSAPIGSNLPLNLQCLINGTQGFVDASVDVTRYAGQTLRFSFSMDTSSLAEHREGWYVDDVTVTRTRSSIWVVDGGAIAEIDAGTGTALRTIPIPSGNLPTDFGGGLAGLAFDGTYLYYTSPAVTSFFFVFQQSREILVIDPNTGQTVRTIPPNPNLGLINGLAVDSASNNLYGFGFYLGNFFGDGFFTDKLFRIDLDTGAYTEGVLTNLDMFALAADFDPASGHIYAAFDDGDPFSGPSVIAEIIPDDVAPQVVRTFTAPTDGWITGLAIANGRLYVAENAFGQIYEVDLATGKPVRIFSPSAGNPIALAGADLAEIFNNDRHARATDLQNRPYASENLSITPGDVDWFRIAPGVKTTLSVSALLSDPSGNGSVDASERLVLEVWRDPAHDAAPLAVGTFDSSSRLLEAQVPAGDGAPFFIRIAGLSISAQNNYALTIRADDADEPNNTAAQSINLGVTLGLTHDGLTAYPGDDDWYRFQMVPLPGKVSATITLADTNGNNVIDPDETLQATLLSDTNNDGTPDAVVGFGKLQGSELLIAPTTAAPNQRLWLHVWGGTGATSYSFTIRHHDIYDDNSYWPGSELVGGGPVNVSADPDLHQVEMQIAVNPTNPQHLVIVSHSAFLDANFINRAYMDEFRSFDGGMTWERIRLETRPTELGDGLAPPTDPVVAFDRFGNLYVAYHYHATETGLAYGILARSTDGGTTFSYVTDFTPTAPGFDYNRIQIAIGPDAQNPGQDSIYLASVGGPSGVPGATVYFWASPAANAHGVLPLSLSVRREVSDAAEYEDEKQFPSIAVGLAGEVYVSWWDQPQGQDAGTIRFDVDPDGLGPMDFGTDQIVVNTTLGFPAIVPWQPERGVGTVPFMAIDRSGGQFNGRVYIAYADIFHEPEYDDYFPAPSGYEARVAWTDNPSDPAGANWIAPHNISGIFDPASLANISVDPLTGSVDVIYYQVDYNGGDGSFGVMPTLARSSDGGENFLTTALAERLSTQVGATPPTEDFLFYNGIASFGGIGYAAWADNSHNSDDLEIYFSKTSKPTDLSGFPGIEPDGTIVDFRLSDLTLSVGDDDWYAFSTARQPGKLSFDITLANLNGNRLLDPEEMLVADLYYQWDPYGPITGYVDEFNSYEYTTTPDARGNFHLRATAFNFFEPFVPDYFLRVHGGLDDVGRVRTDGAVNRYSFSLHVSKAIAIHGDPDGLPSADLMILVRNAANPRKLDYFLNDPGRIAPYRQFDLTGVEDFFILNEGDEDGIDLKNTVVLDFSNGPFVAPGNDVPRMFFSGGAYSSDGFPVVDELRILGPALDTELAWDMFGGLSELDFTFPGRKHGERLTQRLVLFGTDRTAFVDETTGSLAIRMFDRPLGYDFATDSYVDQTLDVNLKSADVAGFGRIEVVPYFIYDFGDGPYREDWFITFTYDFKNKSALSLDANDDIPFFDLSVPAPANFNVDLPVLPKLKSLRLIGSTTVVDTLTAAGTASAFKVDVKKGEITGITGKGDSVVVSLEAVDVLHLSAGVAKTLHVHGAKNYVITPADASSGTIAAGDYEIVYSDFGPGTKIIVDGKRGRTVVRRI